MVSVTPGVGLLYQGLGDMMYMYTKEADMIRTQIYLDEDMKDELDRLSHKRRVTISGLIRHAIQQYLGKESSSFPQAVERSFGIWSHREDIGESSAYVRRIRREWERRAKRETE
jgi:predicted DNA-binding protein